MAAASVYVYKGTTPLDGTLGDNYPERVNDYTVDSTIVQNVTDRLPDRPGYIITGWKLWSYNNSGFLNKEDGYPVSKAADGFISQDERNGWYGAILIEPLWSLAYRISRQPTAEDPTVAAQISGNDGTTWVDADADDATYRWYSIQNYEVVPTSDETLTSEPVNGQIGAHSSITLESLEGSPYTVESSYSDPQWSTDNEENGGFFFEITLKAGDVLTIETEMELDFYINCGGNYCEGDYSGNNWSVTILEDATYTLFGHNWFADNLTARATVTRYRETSYTAATLDSSAAAGDYYCRVTFADGAVLDSDTVNIKSTSSKYAINYMDGGGTAFSGTHGDNYPVEHTAGTATTLVSPTKYGWDFGGWFTDSACTGTAISSLGATDYSSDITLYAKWTPAKYSVSNVLTGLTSNGLSEVTHATDYTATLSANEHYSLPAAVVLKAGGTTLTAETDYIYNASNGEIRINADKVTGNLTITAAGVPIEYAISYDLKNGTVSTGNPISYTIETDSFTLTNPTRAAYDFAGWTGTGLSGAQTTRNHQQRKHRHQSLYRYMDASLGHCADALRHRPNGYLWLHLRQHHDDGLHF